VEVSFQRFRVIRVQKTASKPSSFIGEDDWGMNVEKESSVSVNKGEYAPEVLPHSKCPSSPSRHDGREGRSNRRPGKKAPPLHHSLLLQELRGSKYRSGCSKSWYKALASDLKDCEARSTPFLYLSWPVKQMTVIVLLSLGDPMSPGVMSWV